jgi:hypothetical protein
MGGWRSRAEEFYRRKRRKDRKIEQEIAEITESGREDGNEIREARRNTVETTKIAGKHDCLGILP